jgi:DNA-binding transcriptional MerR regulator
MADTSQYADRGRGAAKSAAAYRTISEVSDELDIPQHVLRFWETRFTQVKPLKRGGGRRYYRPEDIKLLRRIQKLLYEEGYTIRGVQKLLREGRIATPAGPAREEPVRRPAAADTPSEAEAPEDGERSAAGEAAEGEAGSGELPEPARAELRAALGELRAAQAALKHG